MARCEVCGKRIKIKQAIYERKVCSDKCRMIKWAFNQYKKMKKVKGAKYENSKY